MSSEENRPAPTPSRPTSRSPGQRGPERLAREAEALRQNLRKRKEQARARTRPGRVDDEPG